MFYKAGFYTVYIDMSQQLVYKVCLDSGVESAAQAVKWSRTYLNIVSAAKLGA